MIVREWTQVGMEEFEWGGQQVLSIAMRIKRTTQQMQQGELIDTARYVEIDRLRSSIPRPTSEASGPLLTTPNSSGLNYSSSHL